MADIHAQWAAGVQHELAFWRAVFAGEEYPDYTRGMHQRIDPATPVAPYIAACFPTQVPVDEVKVLDVGAGPVSCVGWHVAGRRPQLTAIDALAPQYRALLDEFGLEPPVYTQHCDGENLAAAFPAASFNVVHTRNALDHCYDAPRVVRNMLSVLKPRGVLVIVAAADEAECARYAGLHQWNIRVEAGRVLIWRPGERYDLGRIFAGQLDAVEIEPPPEDRPRRIRVRLRKGAAARA